jgi:hypothetical protein
MVGIATSGSGAIGTMLLPIFILFTVIVMKTEFGGSTVQIVEQCREGTIGPDGPGGTKIGTPMWGIGPDGLWWAKKAFTAIGWKIEDSVFCGAPLEMTTGLTFARGGGGPIGMDSGLGTCMRTEPLSSKSDHCAATGTGIVYSDT